MLPSLPDHPRLEINHEREIPRGWAYAVVMHFPDASVTRHVVSLSWHDHDYWTSGRRPPSDTVELVLTCLLTARPALALPPHFDLAKARRWYPAIDRELATRLGSAA